MTMDQSLTVPLYGDRLRGQNSCDLEADVARKHKMFNQLKTASLHTNLDPPSDTKDPWLFLHCYKVHKLGTAIE